MTASGSSNSTEIASRTGRGRERLILAAGQPLGAQAQLSEPVGDRIAREPGELPEDGDPEPLELVREVIRLLRVEPTAEKRHGERGQEVPRPAVCHHLSLPGCDVGAEATGGRTQANI